MEIGAGVQISEARPYLRLHLLLVWEVVVLCVEGRNAVRQMYVMVLGVRRILVHAVFCLVHILLVRIMLVYWLTIVDFLLAPPILIVPVAIISAIAEKRHRRAHQIVRRL